MLAAICAERRTVAVAGTHGKTTHLGHAGRSSWPGRLRPSYIVGGDMSGVGAGAAWEPDGEWLVVEADESDGTFLELGAEAVVVTSVEPDHLDYYGDEAGHARRLRAFRRASRRGPRVVCADDARGGVALADRALDG